MVQKGFKYQEVMRMTSGPIVGTVEDVFSKGFVSISEDDSLSTCLSLFKDEKPPTLAVLDSEGRYIGVLARRWIVRSWLDPSTTKVKTLMQSAPTVKIKDSLGEVARLMIESEIRQLPVYRVEVFLGFITEEDVIHGAVLKKWGSTRMEEIMTRKPFVVEEDNSIGSVISLFRDQDISHVPVVSDGRLTGIIGIYDIIEKIYQPKQQQTQGERIGEKISVLSAPAKHIMSSPVITVLPTDMLRTAEEKMHRFDISSLVVVRRGRPIGIVTKRDFLEPIAQMERVEQKLTVQFSVKEDVEIDELQRGFILDDFDSFTRRFEETLESGTLFVYMKTHGTNHEGRQLIHCLLQLRTVKGSFFTSSEGWNVEETFRLALDRLEKQIISSKEFEYDTEFARTYLRRIKFPNTVL
jgi:CBS domain-containing protein